MEHPLNMVAMSRVLLLVVLVVTSAGLAGCGGGSSEKPTSNSGTASAPPPAVSTSPPATSAPPPATSAPPAAQLLCGQEATTGDSSSKFRIQNNDYNPGSGSQCLTIIDADTGAFTLTSNTSIMQNSQGPSAYPSVIVGCHFGYVCSNPDISNLPVQASDIASANSSWSVSPISVGAWDISYDIWFNQTKTVAGQPNGQPDGTEVMIWLDDHGGVHPASQDNQASGEVTIDGIKFSVWIAPKGMAAGGGYNKTWNVISFRALNPLSKVNLNLLPFFKYAESVGQLEKSWWLIDVEAGFEPWSDAAGLRSNAFSFHLTKTGQLPLAGNHYSIVNTKSQSCVDTDKAGTSAGTNVVQWQCNGDTDQQWAFQPADSGYYYVQNLDTTGLIWDPEGASPGVGAPIDIQMPSTQTKDQWQPEYVSPGAYRFVNRQSGLCFSVPDGSPAWGVQLTLATCDATGAQSFTLKAQ